VKILVYKIGAVSHLEAVVQSRRSSEQTPKYIAECADERAQHAERNNVAGNLPVLQVGWLVVKRKRRGYPGTYPY